MVDPSTNLIVGKGGDETGRWRSQDCTCSSEAMGNSKLDNCSNPRQMESEASATSSSLDDMALSTWHPLRHAAIVAIEEASKRDLLLFPSSEARHCVPANLTTSGRVEEVEESEEERMKKKAKTYVRLFSHVIRYRV